MFKHLIDYVSVSTHANPKSNQHFAANLQRFVTTRLNTKSICNTGIVNEHQLDRWREARACTFDCVAHSVAAMHDRTSHASGYLSLSLRLSLLLLLFLRAACVFRRPMVVVVTVTISQCLTIVLSANGISLIYIRRLARCTRRVVRTNWREPTKIQWQDGNSIRRKKNWANEMPFIRPFNWPSACEACAFAEAIFQK